MGSRSSSSVMAGPSRLIPVRRRRGSVLGAMKGEFEMADGWEQALTDEEADAFWNGR